MILPCSYPVALNRLLDWESSALITTIIGKTYVKHKCPVLVKIEQTLHYKIATERVNIIGEIFMFHALLPISLLDKVL